MRELPHPFGSIETLQPLGAEVDHIGAVRKRVLDEVARRRRQERLTAVSEVADPGGPDDRGSVVALALANIDLTRVRFIDSSGLGVMVRTKKLAQRHGTKLVFTGLTPPVRNVLQLARLEEFLLGYTRR